MTTSPPRPRTLIHPGAFNPIRIQSKRAPLARHVRMSLQPGKSLFDALVLPLAAIGIRHASTTILGGRFRELSYCVAPPDPTHQAVIAYSAPIDVGSAYMIFGNATIGKTMEGKPIVHCHAAFCPDEMSPYPKGGHIIPQASVIGQDAIPVLVTVLDGFELRLAFDPETNIPLLQPYEEVAP